MVSKKNKWWEYCPECKSQDLTSFMNDRWDDKKNIWVDEKTYYCYQEDKCKAADQEIWWTKKELKKLNNCEPW